MDILNPTAPAVPHKQLTSGQAAIAEAEKELQEFKALARGMDKEATDLVKAAKDLVREVAYQREHGKEQVEKGAWSKEEFDQSLKNLTKKQEQPWENLKAKADALAQKVGGPYKMVTYVKEHVLRARGDGVNTGVFGTLSSDQKEVRRVYDNKLKFSFDEAAALYAGLVSYPDGLLTQVHLLQKRAVGQEPEKVEKHGNLYLAAHQQKA
jgi:hypothetical protein